MIKFVYFDVGGVVIRDFSGTDKWEDLKGELGIPKDKSEEFEAIYDKYQDEINTTREIDSLIPIYKREFSIELPENYSFLVDGFIKRFDKNESIWEVIKKTKEKYGTGLLTNMYPGMLGEIEKAELFPNVVFDQIIDSSVEKVQKPYKEIFELAEKRSGFRGNEILFIDNSQKNLVEPQKLGWKTFFYDLSKIDDSNREIIKLL